LILVATEPPLADASGTAPLLAGSGELAGAMVWLKLTGAFELVFVALSLRAFGPLTRAG